MKREEPEKSGDHGRSRLWIITGLLALAAFLFYLVWGGKVRESWQREKLADLNVILITLDTMRADHVSCYDKEFVATPAIDSLAAGGVVFENCIAQTPLTLPSHTTILSGTYPFFHQVRDNGGFVVPPQIRFISEILQEHEFRTAAFIASYVLHSKWGVNQGFDSFSDRFDLSRYKRLALGEVRKNAADVLLDARTWLERNGSHRFFAWVHLYDPHSPYDFPSPFREKYAGQPYRGAVAYMDEELGKFFAFLKKQGLWDNSLIIATGDHGESLGEHREQNHGFFIYESCVRVPLIVHAPFSFTVKRVRRMVEHVDLAPTIIESLKIKTTDTFQGRSLLPLLLGKHVSGMDSAYTETYYPRLHFGWSELKACYSGKWKYILAPEEELYEWPSDRAEAQNLLYKNSFERNRVKSKLNSLVSRYSRNALKPVNFKDSDPESLAKLHALGYITATVDTSHRSKLADPKNKIGIYLDLTRAREMSDEGQTDLAIATVEKIVTADPEIIDAHMFLGNLFYNKRDFPRALGYFQEVLRKKPDYNFAMLNVINTLIAMKEWQKVQIESDRFLALFPDDPMLNFKKGTALLQKKDERKALEFFQKTVRLDPANVQALNKIGEIYFSRKDYTAAGDFFDKALAVNPESTESLFNLALIEDEKGNAGKAEAFYRQTLAASPQHLRAAYNLAELLRKTDRYAEAVALYQKTIEINPDFSICYFMVAKYYLDRKKNLPEAIRLCERGVRITPADKYTAFGYYILSDIYSYLRQSAAARQCLEKADAIMKKTQRTNPRN
jgi:arylsulfatase A-like enzyme/Tfp pilus assembly protein PilF